MKRTFSLLCLFICPLLVPSPASAADVSVSIDFAQTTGRVASTRHYGLNMFQIYNPSSAENQAYRAGITAMRPGLLRLHSWEMLEPSSSGNGWLQQGATPAWDSAKIKRALATFPFPGDVIVNIPAYPGATDEKLTGARSDAFAAFCAELVRIINVEAKKGFKYWEIPNEQEGKYSGSELADLVLKTSAAMKKVDPTIKVGGPALTQPYAAPTDEFLRLALDRLDFVSFHQYGGAPNDGDLPTMLKHADEIGGGADSLRSRIAKITSRPMELFHDEWNVAWSGPDDRMTQMSGAMFDALALAAIARSGATGAAAWNDADGWYGKLEGPPGFARRPGSHVFELYATYLTGPIVKSTTTANAVVSVYSTAGDNAQAFSLVNRTTEARTVRVMLSGNGSGKSWSLSTVTSGGRADRTITTDDLMSAQGITLPASSVSVFALKSATMPTKDAGVDGKPPSADAGVPPQSGTGGKGTGGAGGGAGSAGGVSGSAGASGKAGQSGEGTSSGGSAGGADENAGGAGGTTDTSERDANGCSYSAQGAVRNSFGWLFAMMIAIRFCRRRRKLDR